MAHVNPTATRNLRHLFLLDKPLRVNPAVRALQDTLRAQSLPVPAADRILKWNIVAGDKVRSLKDLKKKPEASIIQEVLTVDKERNLVFVKGVGAVSPTGGYLI